jgi:hypothetical protein
VDGMGTVGSLAYSAGLRVAARQSYLGYSGRHTNLVAIAAHDPGCVKTGHMRTAGIGYCFLCMRQKPWPKGSLQKAADPCLAFSKTCSFLAPASRARARAASRSST